MRSIEIHFAYTNTRRVTDVAADDETHYSIDPALAVDGAGRRPLVFMKDDEATYCHGDDAGDYPIYNVQKFNGSQVRAEAV